MRQAALIAALLVASPVLASDRVLLESIQTLTFRHDGSYTAARRGSPIPTMRCVGGDACYEHVPEVVSCKNLGSDGSTISWQCTSDLPNSVRFGTTDVSCEGYSGPNDAYVLKGSCGLEYTMYKNVLNGVNTQKVYKVVESRDTHYREGWFHRWTGFAFDKWSWIGFFIVAYLVYRWAKSKLHWISPFNSSRFGENSWFRSGGYRSGYGGYSGHNNTVQAERVYTGKQHEQYPQQSHQNNFWSAAGLGAAAGYLFGNRNHHNVQFAQTPKYEVQPIIRTEEHLSTVPEGSRMTSGFGTTKETHPVSAIKAVRVEEKIIPEGSRMTSGFGTTKETTAVHDENLLNQQHIVGDDQTYDSRNASGFGTSKRR